MLWFLIFVCSGRWNIFWRQKQRGMGWKAYCVRVMCVYVCVVCVCVCVCVCACACVLCVCVWYAHIHQNDSTRVSNGMILCFLESATRCIGRSSAGWGREGQLCVCIVVWCAVYVCVIYTHIYKNASMRVSNGIILCFWESETTFINIYQ